VLKKLFFRSGFFRDVPFGPAFFYGKRAPFSQFGGVWFFSTAPFCRLLIASFFEAFFLQLSDSLP